MEQRKRNRDDFSVNEERRLFVYNIAFDVDWQQLKAHFSTEGEVVYAGIMKDKLTGKSKGCGIVEYATLDEVMHALSYYNGSQLNGRAVFVRRDIEDRMARAVEVRANQERIGQPPSHFPALLPRPPSPPQHAHPKRTRIIEVEPRRHAYGEDMHVQPYRPAYNEVMYDTMDERGYSGGPGRLYPPAHDLGLLPPAGGALQYESGGSAMTGYGQMQGGAPYGGGGPAGGRRLFAYNLGFDVKWQQLKDHMKVVGPVTYCSIITDPKDKSRSKGCGIVEYERAADAAKALAVMQGSVIDGRPLRLREDQREEPAAGPREAVYEGGRGAGARPRLDDGQARWGEVSRERKKTCQVVVHGIPFSYDVPQIKDMFRCVGHVAACQVMRDKATNLSRGFATVLFDSPDVAQAAIQKFNHTELHGRQLHVKLDEKV